MGSKLKLTVHDGDREYEKEIEIAAVGNYRTGLTNYAWLIMAKEAADRLSDNNSTRYFHVYADKDYDQKLFESLDGIVKASGRLGKVNMTTGNQPWQPPAEPPMRFLGYWH